MISKTIQTFSAGVCLLMLASCSSVDSSKPQKAAAKKPAKPASRYSVEKDFSPGFLLNPDGIIDAIPREEPIKKAGNKSPYVVFGKTYELMPTAKGYVEEGGASWYGLKFHGHKTSNGEVYSIYDMTAAHKTLPIPSYVKVTNLANGKDAIVRVNDRGPFHEERIIDLSYAAATKLGYITTGTTQVRVEAIDPATWHEQQVPFRLDDDIQDDSEPKGWQLQVGAFTQAGAKKLKTRLDKKYPSVFLEQASKQLWRVKIGPLNEQQVDKFTQQLIDDGLGKPAKLRIRSN